MTDASVVEDGAVPDAVRRKLALALDTDDLVAAHRLGVQMRPWFGVAKIGLELFSAAGPDAIGSLRDLGYQVFLDLKLFDIPTTVNRSTRVLGALGVDYLTMHAHGGLDMLKAGVEGLYQGAELAGLDNPVALAVTVLTSDDNAPEHIVPNRVRTALEGDAAAWCSRRRISRRPASWRRGCVGWCPASVSPGHRPMIRHGRPRRRRPSPTVRICW